MPRRSLRRSKTDQTGQGAAAPISEFTSQALALLKPASADPQDRVFNLSSSTVSRRMKAAAQAAGIDSTHISSHSPRVGMAQDLVVWGADMPGLMQACRWTNAATTARYIQRLAAQHTTAAQYLKTHHTAHHRQPSSPDEPLERRSGQTTGHG